MSVPLEAPVVEQKRPLAAALADSARPEAAPPQDPGRNTVHQNLYLIGRPRLKDFTRYVRSHAVSPPPEGELADAWQTAHEVVRRLETEEAGAADDPPFGKLGPEYEPLLIEFLQDPLVRNGFNTVPTEVAMVELDRLVVYQKHIDLTFAAELARRLGPTPSDEAIFRFCLLHDHNQPPATWSRVHKDRFVFVSPSNDLRYLGFMPLEPRHIKDYPPPGNFVGVVGVAVGFGSNFMNAVYAERRLVLNNGSHRAYTLRKLGITHIPCIVQHVSSRAELELVGPSQVRRNPDVFLKGSRPAMLKDYFNPQLQTVMPVRRRLHTVTVRFDVDENYQPVL